MAIIIAFFCVLCLFKGASELGTALGELIAYIREQKNTKENRNESL